MTGDTIRHVSRAFLARMKLAIIANYFSEANTTSSLFMNVSEIVAKSIEWREKTISYSTYSNVCTTPLVSHFSSLIYHFRLIVYQPHTVLHSYVDCTGGYTSPAFSHYLRILDVRARS